MNDITAAAPALPLEEMTLDFLKAADQHSEEPNPRMFALYLGLCFEELGELCEAVELDTHADFCSKAADSLKEMSLHAELPGVRALLLSKTKLRAIGDGSADLAWVATALGQVARINMAGVIQAVGVANLAKRHPDGKLHRNAMGKVIKPEGWAEPNIDAFLPADAQ